MRQQQASRRRVAVVGGGVAGLTAAHVLQRSADVWLYEAAPALGGHADTHEVADRTGGVLAVDTGFIVHNERTYPTLLRLFRELGVATQAAEMSMSVRCEGCGLEYAGARGLGGLFARSSSLLRGRYLRLLGEVLRFHRAARAVLAAPVAAEEQTLADFLAAGGYSRYFRQHFVVPLVSCVWSCAAGAAEEYPARYLFAFLANHGLLTVTGAPQWKTVVGGSGRYVRAVAKELTAVHTATPVAAVRRLADRMEICDEAGESAHFDAVVLATHADQALRLLAEPTPLERTVLGAFGYSRNHTVLHTDTAVLPRSQRARASWNYLLADCAASAERVQVSYDMTRLQRLVTAETYVVTLNPDRSIASGHRHAEMVYEHPIYTPATVAAQRRLPELNSARLAFAGAYHGWGFHEDGARAGLAAAEAVGGRW